MQDPTFCSYPVQVRRERRLSTRVRTPHPHIRLRPLDFPWPFSRRRWAVMGILLAGVAAACIGVGVLVANLTGGGGRLPGVPIVTAEGSEQATDTEENESAGGLIPPDGEDAGTEAPTAEQEVTLGESAGDRDGASEPPADSETHQPVGTEDEGTVAEPSATETPDGEETVTEETSDAGDGESLLTDTSEPSETSIGEGETTGGELETAEPSDSGIPEGLIPILSQDVSEVERGVGYIVSGVGALPPSLPVGRLWEDGTPAVLLVNTHPYEGFSDGSSLYDPASGGLAVTETPFATDGMVAFGSALTRALRGMGFTVIHLRVAVSADDSAAEIYDRTETMIRYYCRLYPDIGLVLDLRRSAELLSTGEILRTAGCYNGEDCAQIRISVNGGKEQEALAWDLKAAVALREALWGEDPSISRPVRVKSGKGLIPELTGVRVLTLEVGSAGNTYAEAERLVSPLAAAVGRMLEG